MFWLLACAPSGQIDQVPNLGRVSARHIEEARGIILDGGIPQRERWTAEGVLAGHDYPSTRPEDCSGPCPRLWGARIDPIDGSGGRHLFHLAIDAADDQPARRTIVALDVSGMTITKLAQTTTALMSLADHYGPEDHLGLVLFSDTAQVKLEPTPMDDAGRSRWRSALEKVEVLSGTNATEGLRVAYEQLFDVRFQSGVDNTVMLLTDDRPSDLPGFLRLARVYAEAGAPLHLVALGVDLGSAVANEVESTAGGRYRYIDSDAIETLFDDEPISPACTGATVTVQTPDNVTWTSTLGFPAIDSPTSDRFRLPHLAADMTPIGLVFERNTDGADFGSLEISCLEEPVPLTWNGGKEIEFVTLRADDEGVFTMGALVDEVYALDIASAFCEDEVAQESARTKVRQAADRLQAEAELIDSEELEKEAELMDRLWENLDQGEDACF